GEHRGGERRVRLAEAGQVGCVHGAVAAGEREEAHEQPAGARAVVQAQERRPLLETAPRRHGVMYVQLTVAALEVAAADPRRLSGLQVPDSLPGHGQHSAMIPAPLASGSGSRTLRAGPQGARLEGMRDMGRVLACLSLTLGLAACGVAVSPAAGGAAELKQA